ncbi:MAG: NTP transferase domain-containing protein [FCB group bacterium]|nr:NTP transferase domain-containing protein [FCB group bacterium]
MQGIILTGGQGTRLRPLTDTTNKHLLDICGKPMIHHSLSILASAGVKDVTLVSNPHHLDRFREILPDRFGGKFEILRFVPQQDKPGIGGSIQMVPKDIRRGPFMLVLGDNLLGGSTHDYRDSFEQNPDSALTLLSKVKSPKAFGVMKIENGRAVEIEEKPQNSDSHWAITGIYFLPSDLFEIASQIKPSARGEYEVTDILAIYLQQNRLEYQKLACWWVDAGTHKSLAQAKRLVSGEINGSDKGGYYD